MTNGGSNTVSQYDIGSGGELSPKSAPTAVAGDGPIVVSPDGSSAYVISGPSELRQYDVGAGGELSPKGTPTVGAGSIAFGIAASLDGSSAYVANIGADNVSQYDVGAGGALSAKSAPTVSAGFPIGIAVRQPAAEAAPANLTFGTPTPTPRGTVSAPQTVTYTNTGNAPLRIKGWGLAGATPATSSSASTAVEGISSRLSPAVPRSASRPRPGARAQRA